MNRCGILTMAPKYRQYILVLDLSNADKIALIQYLEKKHTDKRKNNYSAILRIAFNLLIIKDRNASKQH